MSNNDLNIQAQQAFYNERWKDFAFADWMKLERCAAILNALHATGVLKPRIIEIGCGQGWLTAILGSFGPAQGVDLSAQAIADASKRYSHVQFTQANLGNWAVPQKRFDVVVSHEVVEHVEDQDLHLRTAYELLDDGGYLILTTPNLTAFNAIAKADMASREFQPIEKWINARTLRRMLESRGFEVKALTSLNLGDASQGIFRVVNSAKLGKVLGWLGLKQGFDRTCRQLGFGLHILAVAQKPSQSTKH